MSAFMSVTRHVDPAAFMRIVSAMARKERVGQVLYQELLKTSCHVEVEVGATVAREYGEKIEREELSGSIKVDDVDLDQEGESVLCDLLAQFLSEAAHDAWVTEGHPDDWFHADLEYLDSDEAPTLMIGGFRLTFERAGFVTEEPHY